jgi:hypothetical protein
MLRTRTEHVTGRMVFDDGDLVAGGAREVDDCRARDAEAHDEDVQGSTRVTLGRAHQSSAPGMLMKSA